MVGQTFNITITPQNDPPVVATNLGLTVLEDSVGNVIGQAVLESTDVEQSAAQLTYTLTQPRAVAAVEVRVDGRVLEAWGGEGVMVAWPWRRPEGALPRW